MQKHFILKEKIEPMLEWGNCSVRKIQRWLAAQGFLATSEEITMIIREIQSQRNQGKNP